jgi:hypothetical protein
MLALSNWLNGLRRFSRTLSLHPQAPVHVCIYYNPSPGKKQPSERMLNRLNELFSDLKVNRYDYFRGYFGIVPSTPLTNQSISKIWFNVNVCPLATFSAPD